MGDEAPTDEENAAATKLQSVQRGRAARADVEKLKAEKAAAESAAKEAATAAADAQKEATEATEAEKAAAEISGTDDEQAAATKLQAVQRGRAARAKVADLKSKQLAAEAQAADAEAAIEFAGTDEENAAATKLQATARGRVARAKLKADKAAADAKVAGLDAQLAAAEAEEVQFDGTEEEQTAATKLQAVQRGGRARSDVEQLKKDRQAAASAADVAGSALATAGEAEGAAGGGGGGGKGVGALNGYYDAQAMRRAPGSDEMSRDVVNMFHSFGFESTKRNNLAYITDDTLMFTVGNMVQTLDLTTLQQTYLHGIDGKGVGMVCVHPTKRFFALGEKGTNPNVYIYEYPSLRLSKVLRGGTEQAYSCGRFSPDGTKFASVGGYPDFWLTVWNWEKESIVLRSKAFSQEVFDVHFSPFFEGQLTSSGTGHIRFWKMAGTFTGLKLQGDIGRFGNEDLSDVAGYAELPDGKVLSGTESGRLLMWDGGLIKAVLLRSGGEKGEGLPCHEGNIEVVKLDEQGGKIYTAGADGYVRVWDFTAVNDAEPGEDSSVVFIQPLEEIRVGTGEPPAVEGALPPAVSIKSLIMEEDHWVVQDESGSLVHVPVEDGVPGESRQLASFHAGPITGLDVSLVSDHAATCGADGTVRLFAYAARQQLFSTKFAAPATFLSMAPTRVDASGRAAIVGFEDGVVRVVLRCADEWKLVDCVKPHKKAVTAAEYSPSGKTLATASLDGTVFFLSATKENGVGLEPIGFAAAPGPVTVVSWSEDGATLLVGCETGDIVEMTAPVAGSVDTSHTYEVNLQAKFYEFKRPRAPLTAAPTPAAADDDGEPDPDADAATAAAAADLAARQAAEDEAERLAVYPVKTLAYIKGGDGSFELTVGGKAAGKVFACSMDSPAPLSHSPTHDAPLSVLRPSPSGKLVVSAAEDGSVRVAPANARGYWQGEVHDGQYGKVSGAAVSRDDRFLLSAAKDGSFFIQVLGPSLSGADAAEEPDVDAAAAAAAADATPKSAEDPAPVAADITSPTHYSIEEAKQKTEEDNLRAAAEEKKLGVRGYLEKLRTEFLALVAENAAKPSAERLPKEAFEVDPGLRAMIEAETQQKMDRTRRELAWESEKIAVGMAKLKAWFTDPVEVERVVMRSFFTGRRGFSCTTFRVAKLSAELRNEIAKVHAADRAEARNRMSIGTTQGGGLSRTGRPSQIAGGGAGGGGAAGAGGADGDADGGSAGQTKQELRRLQRKAREEEWAAFNATKPDDKYENPDDVAAIEDAKSTMGDFKLKTDPTYVVPEDQRVNTDRKRRQMVLLEEAVYDIKMDFNGRFLALRDVRAAVVREVQGGAKRIAEITEELQDAQLPEGAEAMAVLVEPFQATPLADEYPTENREEVTDAQLAAFDVKRKAEAAAKAGGGLGGFGGGGGGGGDGGEEAGGEEGGAGVAAPDAAAVYTATAAADAAAAAAAVEVATVKKAAMDPRAAAAAQYPGTALEEAESTAHALRLRHERARLVSRRREMVTTFDASLKDLRREKASLEAELKAADMKRLVVYQELVQLKQFEKRENVLKGKLDNKMAERDDIAIKTEQCTERLEGKTEETEGMAEKKKTVLKEFDGMVDESNQFREPLLKIFLKKIKRLKKKAAGEDDFDEEDEEEEEEDDDDEDFDEEDEEEEVCPPGCDQALYDKVLALREKRLDHEDIIGELNKLIDTFKKERDALVKKAKTTETSLKAINDEIQKFQKEKQHSLNQIDVTVTLRMHQMEYLYDQKLPTDLSEGLVFSRRSLARLHERIDELVGEKAALRVQQRDLRREHVQLQRTRKERQGKIVDLEKRAVEVQMLKFGQLIDLEALDRAGMVNKGAEELREQLKSQEVQFAGEMKQWNSQMGLAQQELTRLTAENTACLNAVADLTKTQRDLEHQLTSTQQNIFVDPQAARRKEVAERDHLVQVVNAQAREIDTLKAEINVLSRKGGQVYS